MTGSSNSHAPPPDASRINLDGLHQAMDEDGIDLLVAASADNFTYLTGTLLLSQKIIPDRLCMVIVPRAEPVHAFLCSYEEQQLRMESWITDIQTYIEFAERPMAALAEHLKRRGYGAARIGIEKRFLAAGYVEELASLLPQATLVAGDGAFGVARSIKTPIEIELLTEAARCPEQAIFDAFQAARPGDTEQKVADDLCTRILNAGGTNLWIVLAVGPNTAINHPYPGDRKLEPGQTLRVDVGAVFRGYQSDVGRTAVVGPPNDEQKSVYGRLRQVQQQTIAAARSGVRACDLYDDCKRALAQSGLAVTSQAIGHGFGVGMHEFPMLTTRQTAELKSGMVLNIEPAVKDSQGFLYHIEDLFVVCDAEPTILTTVMNADEIFVIR